MFPSPVLVEVVVVDVVVAALAAAAGVGAIVHLQVELAADDGTDRFPIVRRVGKVKVIDGTHGVLHRIRPAGVDLSQVFLVFPFLSVQPMPPLADDTG